MCFKICIAFPCTKNHKPERMFGTFTSTTTTNTFDQIATNILFFHIFLFPLYFVKLRVLSQLLVNFWLSLQNLKRGP